MVGLARGTVELEAHDPAWREAYAAEVERVHTLVPDAFLGFEHVGSTAVAGIPAKPVIDMLGFVSDLDAISPLVETLEANGYERRPDDVSDRVFVAKGRPENRTHYLSLVEPESDTAREQVAFRDYLRANPETARAYAELKRDLAGAYPDERSAYTAAKSEFIEDVLERAMDR